MDLKKKMRGQAAMEFLMTYGWAILIMLVVIAVLFYLGVFNTGNLVPKSCTLPAGFTCNEFEILNSTGAVYLDIGQATGRTINITHFGCSDNATAPTLAALTSSVSITNGQHAVVTSLTTNNKTCCTGGTTSPCKARIMFNYSSTGSTLVRVVYGDIGGPVP